MSEDDPAEEPSGAPTEASSGEVEEGVEQAVEQVRDEHVTVETGVEQTGDGEFTVTRSAAFATVADRPKKTALDNERLKNDVDFFEDLRQFDAELAGTIRAQSQSAGAGMHASHPDITGQGVELGDDEREMTDRCGQLLDAMNLRAEAMTIFRQLICHGNHVEHIEYDEGEGITKMTPLPLRALTIIDAKTLRNEAELDSTSLTTPSLGGREHDSTITDGQYYVLDEGTEAQQVFPAHDILHLALNRRGNWHKDNKGRWTYGVWGERRLEPVRYSLQAKENTLANKVAMDDKLLAREFYRVDVEALFGHLDDPEERQKKAEEYADHLREIIEGLDADQKPVLPQEVEIEVEGPSGETARKMSDFIQTMNDSIQHALTYHVASFGRDAGGSSRGNRPAKEMSENSVRHLRDVVSQSFRRLFEIHVTLSNPDVRRTVEPDAGGPDRYAVVEDVDLPELAFDPVDPQEEIEKVRNAITLYEKGVADLNEARAMVDLEPIDDTDLDGEDAKMFFKNPTTKAEDEQQRRDEMNEEGPGGNGGEEDTRQQDDDTGPDGDSTDPDGNRRSMPTDSQLDSPIAQRVQQVMDEAAIETLDDLDMALEAYSSDPAEWDEEDEEGDDD